MSKWTLFTNKAGSLYRSCQFWIKFLVKYITEYLSVMSLLWKLVQGGKSGKIPFGVHYNLFSPLEAGYFGFRLCSRPPQGCPAALPTWSCPSPGLHPPRVFILPFAVHRMSRSATNPGPAPGATEIEQSVQCLLLSFHPPTYLSRGGCAAVYTRNSVEKERNLQEGKQVI